MYKSYCNPETQAGIADVMHPILQREWDHISSGAVFRARNMESRETCGEHATFPGITVDSHGMQTHVELISLRLRGFASCAGPRSAEVVYTM